LKGKISTTRANSLYAARRTRDNNRQIEEVASETQKLRSMWQMSMNSINIA